MTTYIYDGCRNGTTCVPAQQLNGIGRLTRVELPIAEVEYEYDARGNAITEQRHFKVPGQPFEDTRTVRHTYSDHGAVWFSSAADGNSSAASITFGGDTFNYLRSEGATLTASMFDARGMPKMVGWLRPTGFTSIARLRRNVAGLPVSRVSYGGTSATSLFSTSGRQKRTWQYDALGRVESDILVRASGTTPLALIDYYATGDVETLTSALGHTVRYAYDTRHQIVGASAGAGPGGRVESSLTYTDAGRIATATVQAPTNGTPNVRERSVSYEYSSDASTPEQLDVMRNTSGDGAYASFAYNAQGATIERTIHNPMDPQLDKTWTMTHDGDGRLRVLGRPQPSGGSELYFYDHNGQRMLALERTEAGAPVKLRMWMGGTEVHYGADGNETKTRAHVSLGGPVARIENRSDVEFTYHNGLGHLVLATKADGTDAMAYSYTAFGEVFDQVGDDPGAHLRRFNGKEVDAESGLAYYGFRYYDPVAMQWTRADPLFRFVPDKAFTEPRRANLYVFTLNNPTRYVDPD